MHNRKYVIIHAENNPIDVYQAIERFWIPHNLVEDEGRNPKPITNINLQEVSMGVYRILQIDI